MFWHVIGGGGSAGAYGCEERRLPRDHLPQSPGRWLRTAVTPSDSILCVLQVETPVSEMVQQQINYTVTERVPKRITMPQTKQTTREVAILFLLFWCRCCIMSQVDFQTTKMLRKVAQVPMEKRVRKVIEQRERVVGVQELCE